MPEDAAQLGFFADLALTPTPSPPTRASTISDALTRLATEAARASDPVARAGLLVQLACAAEAAAGDAIREANRAGRSWRSIGTQLGVPHQTVHRQFRERG